MQTAAAISEAVRSGRQPARQAVEEALQRIEALEATLEAWVEVDAAGAREAARNLRPGATARLAGVPVGIKDIYDVAGMPTRLGAAAFAHYTPRQDAAAVSKLREAGAIIIGKTETTEFALTDPAPTHNPWNLEHTPGGSSSGSAAAVAAGMVPVALGSQTVGSVLRPAAYCGVVGLKPSHGRCSLRGVFPLVPSFDHPGVFARTVADAALVLAVIAGYDPADPRSGDAPLDDYESAARGHRPPVIATSPAFYEGVAGAEVARHIEAMAERFAAAGAKVTQLELPWNARQVRELGQPVMQSEAAALHFESFAAHGSEYRPAIRNLITAGLERTAVDYLRAREALRDVRTELIRRLEGVDALLVPSAPEPAPRGLASTGDGVFNALASFTGLPAISLPSGIAASGLPLAVQLIGGPLAEARLLAAAAWAERAIGFAAEPALA